LINGAQVLAGVAFVASLSMVATIGIPLFRTFRSRHWQATIGRVLESDIAVAHDVSGADGRQRYWTPRVSYEYRVDERSFVGRRVNFVGFSARTAMKALGRYPPGANVPVWYDPNDPADSVLEKRPTPASILVAGIAASALVISAVSLTRVL
jgi:hypothetical protein